MTEIVIIVLDLSFVEHESKVQLRSIGRQTNKVDRLIIHTKTNEKVWLWYDSLSFHVQQLFICTEN